MEHQTKVKKDFLTTSLLSIFLGMLGVDRFYLNKVGTGLLKLLTFGGLGVWYLIDNILIISGSMKDKNGNELENRLKNLKTSIIVFIVWIIICIGFSLANPAKPTQTDIKSSTPTQSTQPEVKEETPQPINYTFTGTQATGTDAFNLRSGLAKFTFKHSGDSNFIVTLQNDKGETIDYLANAIGAYEGTKNTNIRNDGNYFLDVMSDGDWSISVNQE